MLLLKEHLKIDMHTERKLCEDEGRDQSGTFTSQEMSDFQQTARNLGEMVEQMLSEPLGGNKPAGLLLLDFKCKNHENINVCCVGKPVCGSLLWQFWKMNRVDFLHGISKLTCSFL